MCGKFRQNIDPAELAALLRLPVDGADRPETGTEVSPGRTAAVLTGSADRAVLQRMRFGFASAPGLGVRPVVNARGETMHERPLFRAAFASRRCLIPASLFYEQGRSVAVPGAPLFCLGGLWQPGADDVPECAVVTRAASADLSQIHDRMPLVLADTAACRDWLLRAQVPVVPPALLTQEKTPPADNRQMALF